MESLPINLQNCMYIFPLLYFRTYRSLTQISTERRGGVVKNALCIAFEDFFLTGLCQIYPRWIARPPNLMALLDGT